MRPWMFLAASLAVPACSLVRDPIVTTTARDGGLDAPMSDAPTRDVRSPDDAVTDTADVRFDAADAPLDVSLDAPLDASAADAGTDAAEPDTGTDAGEPDAGEPDAGEPDAGEPDAGEPDAGEPDAGEPDAGADAGEPDASTDAGEPDASTDAGEPDAGSDAGMPDAGPPSCDALYQASTPGYRLCAERATQCEFYARLDFTRSCDDLCADGGGSSVRCYENGLSACSRAFIRGCDVSLAFDGICICTRP